MQFDIHCALHRLLHGAPKSILPEPSEAGRQLPYERVTFCVNVWIGHKPMRCKSFETPLIGAPSNVIDFRIRQTDARTANDALKAPRSTINVDSNRIEFARSELPMKTGMIERSKHHQLYAFELLQTPESNTLLLALPGIMRMKRALHHGTVLTVRSQFSRLCVTSSLANKRPRSESTKSNATKSVPATRFRSR